MTAPTLVAIVAGTEYSLSDAALTFRLEDDGLGMSPVRRITERGPLQHGDTDIGFRLDPRFISLLFGTNPSTDSALDDVRAAVLAIFKPRNDPMSLKWTRSNGDVRQIDCHYAGEMSFPSRERKGFYQKIAVTVRAADPLFYDPTQMSSTYLAGGFGFGFEVPLVVPVAIPVATLGTSRTIYYGGTFLEYPVITITGPITDPVITNVTTGETLDFTGITIAAGDAYTIDTRYGYKTVTNAASVNKIADLSDDSDLATFHLEAAPDAPLGNNTITVAGSSASSVTEITLRWYERFIGV